MTRFSARDRSTEVVQSDRAALWAALTDPDLLPRLTPYLHSIDADGDRWRWNMARIPVLGVSVAPSFTERMTFDEPRRIEFKHDPESEQEKAGVEGTYELEEVDGGTRVTFTEQGVYLDGKDDGSQREAGFRGILETLATYLAG